MSSGICARARFIAAACLTSARSPQAPLLRRSGGMRRMSRAYHASREEGRSLSDGEERPYASMYQILRCSRTDTNCSATTPHSEALQPGVAAVNSDADVRQTPYWKVRIKNAPGKFRVPGGQRTPSRFRERLDCRRPSHPCSGRRQSCNA